MTTLEYQTPASSRAPSRSMRLITVVCLLFVGLQLSLLIGHGAWPPRRSVLIALGIIALLSAIPWVAFPFARLIDALRNPSRLSRRLIFIAIAILSFGALYFEACYQHRTFMLKYQDEFSYLIQSRMIAHGRLWMPAHPLADFFDSFQFIASPIYGSIYFPGAALLFAPGIWFHFPFWVMPLVLSALATSLLYLIVADLVDNIAGILAAVMLVSLPTFRLTSVMELAQAPTLFLSLATIACFCAWRRSKKCRAWWTLAIGIFAGWCAITRPVDAVITSLPVGLAMLTEIVSQKKRGDRMVNVTRPLVLIAMLLISGAFPFLLLQAVFNFRVTHSLTETPFTYFAKLCYPQTEYGFHSFDPSIRPASKLLQKQRFYDEHAVPFLKDHTPELAMHKWINSNGPTTVINGTPHVLLIVLFPVGLLGIWKRSRWVLVSLAPLFVLLYFPYVFFLTHYTLICAPAFLVLIVIGAETVAVTWPRWRAMTTTFLTLAIVMLSISEMALFNHSAWDEFFQAPELQLINQTLAPLSANGQRAIVLFRFDTEHGTGHIEPVYNVDVIWPDDAPVIRAHDLGPENGQLFNYYARIQPDRIVYRFDRASGKLELLGPVNTLAHPL